jgi:hypothetical protein
MGEDRPHTETHVDVISDLFHTLQVNVSNMHSAILHASIGNTDDVI